ncbi:addiction module protein [Halobacteriovorax marinus]|uniref:Addiction module protein n=1 Tax=Halobacteriovorax marinus TaxID=97084 RepID=A0A1Y5FA19_9BACT|nr:addiction module protein [Halobacteriovorax marinus]
MSRYEIRSLETLGDIETKAVLKASLKAHKELGELKGLALTIPNQNILLATLSLQEAKESSAIENIITTHDDLYQSNYQSQVFSSTSAKEVHNYARALEVGFNTIQESNLLINSNILEIQKIIENNTAGFRTQAGTTLINNETGKVVYTPPQTGEEVLHYMGELERFINDNELSDYDVLVKMALIHHQFESIHPFYDGNGRTGRILNILYLTKTNILSSPILYLSRFINQNKSEYYRLLQEVRDTGSWESWLIYMMQALEETARETSATIRGVIKLMTEYKVVLKKDLPKIYSHELINNLFKHPYTKNEFLVEELNVHRNTASKYLEALVNIGLIEKHKIGKENYYLNKKLYNLLSS